MCCLVETFPFNHRTYEEFRDTLEMAFLYAKIVTLGLPHTSETASVMARNRRIGTSMSGIQQFVAREGLDELKKWCDQGYADLKAIDREMSKRLHVNESIKVTSVKPSGTVSLLAGATPGLHYPISSYYIRRMRLPKHSEINKRLEEAGYHMEEDKMDSSGLVVEVPIAVGEAVKTQSQVGIEDQMEIASIMQKHWADNQVSCTVTFDPKTETVAPMLEKYQYSLKGISFLPRS